LWLRVFGKSRVSSTGETAVRPRMRQCASVGAGLSQLVPSERRRDGGEDARLLKRAAAFGRASRVGRCSDSSVAIAPPESGRAAAFASKEQQSQVGVAS
jgi:hypothetical protein